MELRVLALAAPQYPRGAVHERVLNSRDPASLYNACRLAAARAESGLGPWGESNWADGRQARRDTVLLLETAEHGLSRLQEVLLNLRPNLVLIGSMTICFPGAIACARLVRETLGDTVCIVLGGRHVSETIYANRGEIHHHAASPLKLIQQSLIPNLFDFIAAGDGEGLIAEIGEIIGRSRDIKSAVRKIRMGKAISAASGQWILGWADNGRIETISGTGAALDYNKLPAPCEMFGVSSSFEVFEGRPTAHVFSDIGPGCVYSCSFCSEAARVAGKLRDVEFASSRLYSQLAAACRVAREDHPGKEASAFVEDSVLLGGAPQYISSLACRLEHFPLPIRFGAQLTIDQILSRKDLVTRLRKSGLSYLFVGLETLEPSSIGGMSKDLGSKLHSWRKRAEEVFEFLSAINVRCGVALLFGLGESHYARITLLDHLQGWQRSFGIPAPISANWAVQHPLKGHDGGANYRYLDWGVPDGPFLEPFQEFGEASIKYPISGQPAPKLEEVLEIAAALRQLRTVSESRKVLEAAA